MHARRAPSLRHKKNTQHFARVAAARSNVANGGTGGVVENGVEDGSGGGGGSLESLTATITNIPTTSYTTSHKQGNGAGGGGGTGGATPRTSNKTASVDMGNDDDDNKIQKRSRHQWGRIRRVVLTTAVIVFMIFVVRKVDEARKLQQKGFTLRGSGGAGGGGLESFFATGIRSVTGGVGGVENGHRRMTTQQGADDVDEEKEDLDAWSKTVKEQTTRDERR